MDKETQLQLLNDQHRALEKAIGDLEYEIKLRLGRGEWSSPERMASFLQDRYTTQREQIYQLGKVAGIIQEYHRLAEERDRVTATEPHRELAWLDAIAPRRPEPSQDNLDWFRESLAENPPVVDELARAGQRPVPEAEHEASPDNLLGWLPGRGRYP